MKKALIISSLNLDMTFFVDEFAKKGASESIPSIDEINEFKLI